MGFFCAFIWTITAGLALFDRTQITQMTQMGQIFADFILLIDKYI
jgi:hypothetical protein